jgi:hypothetical protein
MRLLTSVVGLALCVAVLGPTACVIGSGGGSDAGADQDAGADAGDDSGADDCLEGSFSIMNSLDVDALEPYPCVTGNLVVSAPGMTSLDLPNLVSIGEGLGIINNDSLADLDGFGALATVGGDLQIGNNASLPQCKACDLLEQLVDFTGMFVSSGNQADDCTDDCIDVDAGAAARW